MTDSRIVADSFGKLHKNVLRDIEALECSEEFIRLNFEPVEYTEIKGEKRPMYNLTRDGSTFLAIVPRNSLPLILRPVNIRT